MKYFFILGNNPSLSIAEILAIFPEYKECIVVNKDVLILDMKNNIDASSLVKKLGGTIKIGLLDGDFHKFDRDRILKHFKNTLNPGEGKFKFGISYYGQSKFNTRALGMEIKKFLKRKGASCRWVVSREKTLSSVVVEQNKLTKGGAEIVIIEHQNKLLVGRTEAVQDFKTLSFRDYKRPARDSRSGMLPPKLAQIMINLAVRDKHDLVLLDPFCGSGTILMEAMLLGVKTCLGSDISEKAVRDTRKNTAWSQEKFDKTDFEYDVFHKSVTEISDIVEADSIDAIATEPYLGPQRGIPNIKKTTKELEELYTKAISEFGKIVKKKGRIVMLWPCFTNNLRSKKPQLTHINPKIDQFKIVNPIPEELKTSAVIKMSHRHTIVYGRDGQRVWREVVILEKR